ncbi:MAG: TatD family deoxyribonuclease [Ruminococcaceae bacterium]|nr:TatD family deoxyribonuclease [Oscillospiraceae bacterium]
MLFDSHAHYDDDRFALEFEGGTDGAIAKATREGVSYIVNVGSNIETSKNSIALAEKYSFIYAVVGIHPSDAQRLTADKIDSALYEVERLAAHEKVVAVGEIGLDYHYDYLDKERQAYFFDAQMAIARKVHLPVVIHTRDAFGDTIDILNRHPDITGVMHSYSGSAESARQLCDRGWYISFSGPVTYKNANKVKEAAAIVPSDRIMIETDCPYLPPVPHRGEINYSGYMKHTCQAVADIRGITFEEAARITCENASRFFGISL